MTRLLGTGVLRPKAAPALVALAGALVSAASFAFYYSQGLTTAHYDAKAHLVVSRRMVDAIHPGYEQMGAHWLPLAHLIYLPFVVFDGPYYSGLFPSLISMAAFVVSVVMVYRLALRASGSSAAGWFAALLLMSNPNLQYLQSCPLTEPLFMALLLLSVEAFLRWREAGARRLPWASAAWTALGALCRYEGWYYLGGILLLLAWDWLGRRFPRPWLARAMALHISVFALSVGSHFLYIYAKTGDSFLLRVARGNPAPFESFGRPFLSLAYHAGELGQIAAGLPVLVGIGGVLYSLRGTRSRDQWLPLYLLWIPVLINVSALYWGLIYRVRYSVLLLPALAVFSSLLCRSERALRATFLIACLAATALPWLSWCFPREWKYRFVSPGPGFEALPLFALGLFLAAWALQHFRWSLLALCLFGMHVPVLQGEYRAMLVETLEHEYIEPERRAVLAHLAAQYDATRILIDMGRLAPLAYDSRLPLREFVYNEGDPRSWHAAVRSPDREVGWLIAEKDDEVWRLLQVDPRRTDRYSLALRTEHFLLYRVHPEIRESLQLRRRSE